MRGVRSVRGVRGVRSCKFVRWGVGRFIRQSRYIPLRYLHSLLSGRSHLHNVFISFHAMPIHSFLFGGHDFGCFFHEIKFLNRSKIVTLDYLTLFTPAISIDRSIRGSRICMNMNPVSTNETRLFFLLPYLLKSFVFNH